VPLDHTVKLPQSGERSIKVWSTVKTEGKLLAECVQLTARRREKEQASWPFLSFPYRCNIYLRFSGPMLRSFIDSTTVYVWWKGANCHYYSFMFWSYGTPFCSYVSQKLKLVLFITIMVFWHKSYQLLHFCFESYIYTAENKRENENWTRESFCNKKSSILTRDIRLDLAFNKMIENEIFFC